MDVLNLPSYLTNNSEPYAIGHAMNFNVIARSNFPELQSLVDEIYKKIPVNFTKKREYIEVILCNCANSAYQGKGFYMFRTCRKWSEYNRTHKLNKVSFRSLIRITNYMEQLGYILRITGRHSYGRNKESYATRYFASNKLYYRMTDQWANFYCDDSRPAVKVHDDLKNDITPKVLPEEVQSVANNVIEQNKFYNKHVMTVMNTTRKAVCIAPSYVTHGKPIFRMKDVLQKSRFGVKLQAIYKNDFEHGGRLYSLCWNGQGNYQGFSSNYDGEETKIDRKSIQIDNEKTVEVDYHCLHVNMAYNMCGKAFTGDDAYGFLPNESRNKAKKTMLIALNSSSEKEAINAVAYHTKVTRAKAKEFIEALKAYHTPLKELLFKSDKCFGLHLQNEDSKIMGRILETLRNRGVVVLPIHDSVICKRKHKRIVQEVMLDEYQKAMGFPITLSVN